VSTHSVTRCFHSKHFWNWSCGMFFSSFTTWSWISEMSSNLNPFKVILSCVNSKNHEGPNLVNRKDGPILWFISCLETHATSAQTQHSCKHFAEILLLPRLSVKIFLAISLFKFNYSAIILILTTAHFPHFHSFVVGVSSSFTHSGPSLNLLCHSNTLHYTFMLKSSNTADS
jgi:hypothetical protein